jgi:hypothetical protein
MKNAVKLNLGLLEEIRKFNPVNNVLCISIHIKQSCRIRAHLQMTTDSIIQMEEFHTVHVPRRIILRSGVYMCFLENKPKCGYIGNHLKALLHRWKIQERGAYRIF